MTAETGGMHPLRELATVEHALSLIARAVHPVDRQERVDLEAAVGRVLAADIRAPEDAPSSNRSRMDGYAVDSADLAGIGEGQTRLLKIAGRALAGPATLLSLDHGTCVEIATGAALPGRADAVVPVEHSRPIAGGELVEFSRPAELGQFIVRRGGDYREGDLLLRAGEVLSPSKVAAAAAGNAVQVDVRARPRVLIVPTGDEVVPMAAPLANGHVRETNSHALAAFVASRGGAPDRHPVVPDVVEDVVKALGRVAAYDAAVFTGGTSAGSKDYLAGALRDAGEILFHGVALRPGKPVLFGRAAGRPVLGLPGNPTSVMVGAHLFLERIIWGLLGAAPPPVTATRAKLSGDPSGYFASSPPDFLTLLLVRLEGGEAKPVLKDSMTVTGAAFADGYIAVPPGKSAPKPGDDVHVVLMR